MSDGLKKLTREMEKVQEPKRFVHTQGVEYTAAALAMRYGEDVERAQVAGLLHDLSLIHISPIIPILLMLPHPFARSYHS